MTIIEYGKNITVIRTVCTNCDSVFDYTEEYDIKLKKSNKKGYEYVVCPVCHKWLTRNIFEYDEE